MRKDQVLCETQEGKLVKVNSDMVVLRTSAYGILVKGNQVLMVQAHLALWEFPGGTPEKGESMFEALRREFGEETGIEVAPGALILERESFYYTPKGRAYHSLQHFFEVKSVRGTITDSSDNLVKATWVDVDDLGESNMNKGAYAALQAFKHDRKRYSFLPL